MVFLEMQIPWWVKLSAKLALARLPLDYAAWRQLPIFKHGFMAEPEYAFTVFKRHFEAVELPPDFVSLELGPGDSLFSALVSYSLGGSSSYLVDTGAYAIQEVEPYRIMAQFLRDQDLTVPDWEEDINLKTILATTAAQYLTDGIHSLRKIPSESINFIWSNAVLEHIRRQDFADFFQELRRVIKPNGVCSHEVDLRDHLGGGLNNLRFSSNWWEQDWVANSGFYTNRIRYSKMLQVFAHSGFRVVDHKILSTWDQQPIVREKMAPEFRDFSDEDLKVSVFSVVLEPI
ncbi:MAG: class I SAM-dependent methyltransferase [Cyanobacteria bacterium P01_A01_bin.37]